MTYLAIQFKWPSWLGSPQPSRVVQVVEPPQPDYAAMIAELSRDIGRTREELAGERAHREMLQRICERQDNELVSISTGLTSAQAELQLARQDKQQQARQIKVLQEEVAILKDQLAKSAEQLAVNNGLRQGLMLANEELKRENAALRAQIAQYTNSVA